jgi:hypothetical protein
VQRQEGRGEADYWPGRVRVEIRKRLGWPTGDIDVWGGVSELEGVYPGEMSFAPRGSPAGFDLLGATFFVEAAAYSEAHAREVCVELFPTSPDVEVLAPAQKRHWFSRQPPPFVRHGTYMIKLDGKIWLFVDQAGGAIDPALTLSKQP